MPRQAISKTGEEAEALFLNLVETARISTLKKSGDATVVVDKELYYVEIKHASSTTINQVRAIKFLPLAVYSPNQRLPWLVLSAQEVVKLALTRKRGQHTEISFESMTVHFTKSLEKFRYSNEQLSTAIQQAIRSSKDYEVIQQNMNALLIELTALYLKYQIQVGESFRKGVLI